MDNDEFKDYTDTLLSRGIVVVEFTKKDGTNRKMVCSTSRSVIPTEAFVNDTEKVEPLPHQQRKLYTVEVNKPEDKPKRIINPNVCVVWDFEKEAWRSFRYDSVIEIKPKSTP